jgi:hypothetical protein
MGVFGQDDPETATVNDKPFKCQVCANDGFWHKEARMQNAGFLNIAWTPPRAELLVCSAWATSTGSCRTGRDAFQYGRGIRSRTRAGFVSDCPATSTVTV